MAQCMKYWPVFFSSIPSFWSDAMNKKIDWENRKLPIRYYDMIKWAIAQAAISTRYLFLRNGQKEKHKPRTDDEQKSQSSDSTTCSIIIIFGETWIKSNGYKAKNGALYCLCDCLLQQQQQHHWIPHHHDVLELWAFFLSILFGKIQEDEKKSKRAHEYVWWYNVLWQRGKSKSRLQFMNI